MKLTIGCIWHITCTRVCWRKPSMVHICETINPDHSITLAVDGRLNRRSLTVLTDLCDRHLKCNRKILLHLKGITHTDELARKYLKSLKNRVEFLSVPEFLKLEINLKLKI